MRRLLENDCKMKKFKVLSSISNCKNEKHYNLIAESIWLQPISQVKELKIHNSTKLVIL